MKIHRICIIGPSSSGKSTLAENLGQQLSYPVLHMDKIAHIPNTDWQRCPIEETIRKHDAFIERPNWIIEGNYGRMMPQRFERADLVIFHKFNRFGCVWRYICRTLRNDKNRAGVLDGGTERLKWSMIKYILFDAPKRNKKYEKLLKHYPHLTVVRVYNFKDVEKLIDRMN
jgi:adenylate kinase family enzyme